MTDDIVDTLRRNPLYIPTSRINSFGRPQMGFELTSFNLIAADEIERLRNDLDGSQLAYRGASYDRDRMRAEIERLRKERDEARKQICESHSRNYRQACQHAIECNWDCYKEEP